MKNFPGSFGRAPAYALLAFLLASLFRVAALAADDKTLDFATFRFGEGSNAALIIGGIQGDEPGGFSAASLLATRYVITEGALWVVPNLNFESIIHRSRGLYGDMNRKFATLDEKDPEFAAVRKIQELIRHPNVKLVLNLHDGGGYYRPRYENKLKNPSRWGQSIIIDQESLPDDVFMRALGAEARAAAKAVNAALLDPAHEINVHDTNTAAGDVEMEKSLSYYAFRHKKAAFGLEASKELSVAKRAYYHLRMIEEFLKMADIGFTRDFELTPAGIETALRENLGVAFLGNRVFLPLENVRPSINNLPLSRNCVAAAIPSKPIMAVLPCKDNPERLCVHYGNRLVAKIKPEWRETDDDLDGVLAAVDGQEKLAAFGQTISVKNSITILPKPGYRVNAIGFENGREDESGATLRRKDFKAAFSVDKKGDIFRVEVYKGKNFSGMFLLRFAPQNSKITADNAPFLPSVKGPESSLGY